MVSKRNKVKIEQFATSPPLANHCSENVVLLFAILAVKKEKPLSTCLKKLRLV